MKSIKIQTEHGFTILEVMLTVMIIGIMALLAIPRILDTDRRAAYTTAHQIVADMRLARANAVTNAEEYLVKFYPAGADPAGPYTGYRIFKQGEQGVDSNAIKSMKIPDQLTVEALGIAGLWPPELVFTPLGSIKDGKNWLILRVTGGGHQVNIESTAATGKVNVQ